MAVPFLVAVNFNKNELQNAVAQVLAVDASTPAQGQFWFDSALQRLRYKDGSAVRSVAKLPIDAASELTGIAPVANGGTGLASVTANAFLYGNGTGALQVLGPLTNGQLVIGSTSAAPVAATLTGSANRIGISNGAGSITITLDATQFPSATVANTVLVSTGANAASWGTVPVAAGGTGAVTLTGLLRGNGTSPITGGAVVSLTTEVTGVLPVANGGTGLATLTAFALYTGNGTSAPTALALGTSGQVLMSAGAGANPAFTSAGGDISGSYSSLTVNTVGGASAASIAAAAAGSHTQNTDTGTTAASFQVHSGSSGPRIKNEAGVLAVRNAADSGYASLRVEQLYVMGAQTEIESNQVNIGDSELMLNADITDDAQNSDGGIAVARLEAEKAVTNAVNNGFGLIRLTVTSHGYATGDRVYVSAVGGVPNADNTLTNKRWTITVIDANTYDLQGSAFAGTYTLGGLSRRALDANFAFNSSTNRWETRIGPDSGKTVVGLVGKAVFTIGDTSTTQFDLAHNFGSRDVIVSVREAALPYETVITDVERTDVNTVRVRFAVAPGTNSKVVTVIG